MGAFRLFIELSDSEERKDIQTTLQKIPPSHAALVHGFRWKFQGGNTLDGDDEHVGYMDSQEKEIAVAAPWNYGREFTILHEIAHRVWERLSQELKAQWATIVANTPDKQNQEPEELFCHAYAATYSKNPPVNHYKPHWIKFINSVGQKPLN